MSLTKYILIEIVGTTISSDMGCGSSSSATDQKQNDFNSSKSPKDIHVATDFRSTKFLGVVVLNGQHLRYFNPLTIDLPLQSN